LPLHISCSSSSLMASSSLPRWKLMQ
jgi:hypothetical protein